MNIPEGYKLVKITSSGVQFGNAWYSHESITGYSSDQLNQGNCCVTGGAYMKWLSEKTPPQPIYDEAKERQLFEDSMIEASEEAGFGEPDLYRDSGGCYRQAYHQAAWGGWIACALARAKAVEETP